MLQKGFFITKSFNWAGRVLVNLSGSQQFVEDTIFPKGVYQVDVVAGATFDGIGTDQPMTSGSKKGVGGKVYTEVTMEVPFIIRAYCGSKGNYGVGGTNPYSGPFKVNALYQESDVKFSHEVTKGELKQLIKTKKAERKLEKKGNK